MCFGGNQAPAPQAPKIEYIGPSEDDIRRNEESLAAFQTQMNEQNRLFQEQLQAQIDTANREYADLETQYANDLNAAQNAANTAVGNAEGAATAAGKDADTAAQDAAQAAADAVAAQQDAANQAAADKAAAAAAGQLTQSGAYQVGTVESEPVNAEETKAITEKKKPKSTLKIGQNTVAAAAGTGLNIGV